MTKFQCWLCSRVFYSVLPFQGAPAYCPCCGATCSEEDVLPGRICAEAYKGALC